MRCALPGFPERQWLPPYDQQRRHTTARKPTVYMGRFRVLPSEGGRPPESHDDGCPGAWYRCAFVRSLHKYQRYESANGFSENLLTSRCEDRLVLEAIALFEQHKLRAAAYDREILDSN